MSSEVSVHVRIGTLRLDFRGDREFYERNVESLVAAASQQEGGAPVAASATPPEAASASKVDVSVPPPAAVVGAPADVETRDAYEPESPEFGRYVRRLGPDADAPDRHVVAFALYLRNYERLETFGMNEIEGCLHAIGRTLPDDGPAIFADLTENKRFLEAAGENRWRLSKKGENYVKTRLLTL